jgi:hypothetical protein
MTFQGLEVSQAQGKKLLESAFELTTAQAKESLKYADELRGRLAEATNAANALLKDQAAVFNEFPKDPVGATQKVIAGYVEGSRKGLEFGSEMLKSYVNLVNDVWERVERVSQETRQNYLAYVSKLQSVVEASSRKS